jgi:hypothetical protein
MAYVSQWLSLSELLSVVIETNGCSKDQAQADICRALNDGTKFRGKLKKQANGPTRAKNTLRETEDFEPLTGIKPEDLDWENSCPRRPLRVRRGAFWPAGDWELEKIEVSGADLTGRLCIGVGRGEGDRPSREAVCTISRPPPVNSGPTSTATPQTSAAASSARRRGVRPKKFEQVRDGMRNDIQQGRLTLAGLKDMLEKDLEANYGVSRDTARKARRAVLSEFGEN